jgi:hypothetical protein
MADIVPSLFGMTPDMYQGQQYQQDLKRGYELAQLTPGAAAQAGLMASVGQLGRGFAGAMGVEDPQLKLITARNSIINQLDQTDPTSLIKGAQMLASMGDQQGAFALADYARKAQSEVAQAQQRIAAANRERSQAMPADVQIASQIASITDGLDQLRNQPASPERDRAMNMLTTQLTQLERLTDKSKQVSANIKEVGVAEKTREPVYLDVNNDQQFIYKQDAQGKQVRVPFTGGVDRTTAKTSVGVKLPEGESEFVKELGKLDAKKVSDAMVTRENAAKTIESLNKLASLPPDQLISGQFASGRVGVTNLLQTLGLASPSDVTKLANSQVYEKTAGDVILQTLGGKLGAGFSNEDRKFIQALIPQLETSPQARKELITFMQAKNQEIIQETVRLENYARDKRGLTGYTPKIPMTVAPSQPRPYSNLSDAELEAKIRAAQNK